MTHEDLVQRQHNTAHTKFSPSEGKFHEKNTWLTIVEHTAWQDLRFGVGIGDGGHLKRLDWSSFTIAATGKGRMHF